MTRIRMGLLACVICGQHAAATDWLVHTDQPTWGTAEQETMATMPAPEGIGSGDYWLDLPGLGMVLAEMAMPEHRAYGQAWTGRLHWPPGQVVLSEVNGYWSGVVLTDEQIFELLPTAPGRVQVIRPGVGEALPEEAPPMAGPVIFEPTGDQIVQPAGDDPIVEVMVLYTPEAEAGAGGESAIKATAQSAVDTMNLAFLNSDVPARVQLVFSARARYSDSDDGTVDLNWLRNDAYVAQLRDSVGADMVAMLVDDMGGFCGYGVVMRQPSPTFNAAFQVTKRSCAVGNLSFAHEFGHNLGLEHNPSSTSVPPSGASYPWSFGHWHDGQYRTVMSYSSPCSLGCSRHAFYSNPDISFLGLPTGIVDARDNARSLEATGSMAEVWRDSVADPGLLFAGHFD